MRCSVPTAHCKILGAYSLTTPLSYPPGEIAFREVTQSLRPNRLLNSRQRSIQRLIDIYPRRKFILVGDFATPGIEGGYSKVATKNDQVQCLFMRDARANNPANHFVPATKPLSSSKLSQRWTVFDNASEFHEASLGYLRRLHISNDTRFGCERLGVRRFQYEELAKGKKYGFLMAVQMMLMKGMSAQMRCIMLGG